MLCSAYGMSRPSVVCLSSQSHDILNVNYKMVHDIYIQWLINRKSYMVYWMASFSITLTQISRARHYSTFNVSDIANTVLYVVTKE